MNWKRGIARLIVVLLAVGGLAVLLIRASVLEESGIRSLVFVWFVFLLTGIAGYCVLRLLQLIVYFFTKALKIRKGNELKGRTIRGEFRELALISAVICSGVLFFLCYAICTKGMNPDYFLALVASFIVFIFSFVLVWAVYGVILFVVRGFSGDENRSQEIEEE
jgi:hypothetical protein